MAKLPNVTEAIVDNTSRAVLRTKEGAAPTKDALNTAMTPQKVKTLREVRRPKIAKVQTLVIDGFA